MLSISLEKFFLKDWRCGGLSTAAATSMKLFCRNSYDCLPLITIVIISSILDAEAALDPLLYPNILYDSLQTLQILNKL